MAKKRGGPKGSSKGGGKGGGKKGGGGGGRQLASLVASSEFLKHPTSFELGVVVIAGAFTAEECDLIGRTSSFPGAAQCHDRDEDLGFHHEVWRIEQTSAHWAATYQKALGLMTQVDESYWRQLRNARKGVHPEVEFILYQVRPGQPLPSIEPHVDNASVQTMVMMLSDRADYEGGESCFEGGGGGTPGTGVGGAVGGGGGGEDAAAAALGDGNETARPPQTPPRVVTLQRGDAVFFRGELCEHWITPVRGGRRSILQIEMCRFKNHH